VVDIMLALPSLLLALVLVAIFGPSIGNAALALTFVALPHYVRLTRAAVLVEVNRDYVTASRVAGAGAMRQMFVNIFPNCLMDFLGNTTYFDATHPGARDYVWGKAKRNYYDKGVKLFWLDEAEPEFSVYDYDNYRYHAGPVLEVGNIYPRMY
ncbi:ABC transporter permease subunit, partial [Salmonella enterica]|uniref:ABC transporter permease subunit n=1 Tax=Salmonella enterica TaxID=28901 RepID=UPI001EED4CB4